MSKKGENIYKRKDNRWEARYLKGHRPDGSPQYGYCYGKTYREAKQKLSEAKVALLTGQAVSKAANRKSFAYYCDEWLLINRNRVKESTYVKYRGILEKHIKPGLGHYAVRAMNSVVIEEFGHELLYQQELAPKTVKDILTMLHSVIKYTARQVPGAMGSIEIPYPKVPKQEMRVLSTDEQIRLVKYLVKDMDQYKFGVLLAMLTGMRIGEVCALRWENVSLTDRTVLVCATMQRLRDLEERGTGKTRVIISDPKSSSSARLIPLTDYCVRLFRSRLCVNPAAFVLTGETGRFVEPRTLQYRLKRYTKECGLEGVHFHTLRHTFATRCVEVDFEIKSLSEILGHSSPRITLERYVHSSMKLKRDNMNKLAAIGY